jgi:hypothetical protein
MNRDQDIMTLERCTLDSVAMELLEREDLLQVVADLVSRTSRDFRRNLCLRAALFPLEATQTHAGCTKSLCWSEWA